MRTVFLVLDTIVTTSSLKFRGHLSRFGREINTSETSSG